MSLKPIRSNNSPELKGETAMTQRTSSGAGYGFAAILFALLFIFGPIFATALGVPLPPASQLMLMGFGVALLIIGMIITTFTRLYYRAPADRAFVRTGMGGPKPIIDGGAMVIPVVHDVIWVSLQTMRLEVTRQAEDALITRDYLRADITAEFYIKVPKNPQSVLTAATSLGVGAIHPDTVRDLLEKKLVSALRQVAAEMEITELLVNRAAFIEAVSKHVKSDIANNGLELESVTISKLDQTQRSALRAEDNVFDAQGARKITEIVSEQRVQSTQFQLAADRKIAEERVRTDRFLYEQEVARAAAEASREREIRVVRATAEQEAATKAAEQARLSKVAEVERDRAIQLAEVTREQAVQVANQERDRAASVAEVAKNQALEVANREREIAVATKERERAQAVAEQMAAEAVRAAREQEVTTVNVTAEAERRKAQAVIDAQAETERRRLEEEMKAKVAAFAVVTAAQAEQESAERRAQALLTQAEASQKARSLEAQGEQALQMVPVEVDRQRVEVEQARVTVMRNELASKAEFESIARQLQVELARIEAEKQARIAQAEAFGQAMGAANMTIWGDPNALTRMSESFYRGQSVGMALEGFGHAAPPAVQIAANGLGALIAAYAQQKLGIQIDPAQAEDFLKSYQSSNGAAKTPSAE